MAPPVSGLHPDPQPWTTAGSRRAFENRWLSVYVDQVTLAGREAV